MSRKIKIPRSSKRPSHSRGGTVMGILIGMILGALIVLAGALLLNRNDNPFSPTKQAEQVGAPTGAQPASVVSFRLNREILLLRIQFYLSPPPCQATRMRR